jgi:hypothetical protein
VNQLKPLHLREFPEDLKADLKKIAIDKRVPLYQLIINVLRGYVDKNKS